jgi:hypothetical protein
MLAEHRGRAGPCEHEAHGKGAEGLAVVPQKAAPAQRPELPQPGKLQKLPGEVRPTILTSGVHLTPWLIINCKALPGASPAPVELRGVLNGRRPTLVFHTFEDSVLLLRDSQYLIKALKGNPTRNYARWWPGGYGCALGQEHESEGSRRGRNSPLPDQSGG